MLLERNFHAEKHLLLMKRSKNVLIASEKDLKLYKQRHNFYKHVLFFSKMQVVFFGITDKDF